MPEFALKSAQFRREREDSWRQLEVLVERVESGGLGSLSAAEVALLPSLYRSAVSSLSVAGAISLDRNLLDYLNALVGRAYLCVYGTKTPLAAAVGDFLLRGFAREVRRQWRFVAAAFALLLLGVLAGYRLTAADLDRFDSFVPQELAQGRGPGASTEKLRKVLYEGAPRGENGMLGAFAAALFSHNTRVGVLCFVLGLAAGVPVFFLLFENGLILGAMAAVYASRGLGGEFWVWVLPHGVTELSAVALCGAAGLVLGHSLVFPGTHRRLDNLAREGRRAALLALGATVMFLLAGTLEGIFRQAVLAPFLRGFVALASTLFWLGYFLLGGQHVRHPRR